MGPVELSGTMGGTEVEGRLLPGCTGRKPKEGSPGAVPVCPNPGWVQQAIAADNTAVATVFSL